jgi:hypothetical protein
MSQEILLGRRGTTTWSDDLSAHRIPLLVLRNRVYVGEIFFRLVDR